MKITNQKYPHLNLAEEEDRGTHLILDFLISSLLTIPILLFTYQNITISILLYFSIRYIYYIIFEYKYGRTLGKFHTQSKVVTIDNNKPSILQLLIRNLSRFITTLSGITDDETALHDQASNTFVVKDKALKKIEIKKPLYFVMNSIGFSFFIYQIINSEKNLWDYRIETIIYIAVGIIIFMSLLKAILELFDE